ncbi:MAG: RhuM family protein, partial [Bacteroidota bacterium]
QLRAKMRRPMYMQDWLDKLDGFLKLHEMETLNNAGKVSRKNMLEVVRKEVARFQERLEPGGERGESQ